MLGFKNAKQTEARERSYYRKDRAIWKQSKSVEAAGLGNAKGDGLPWPCGDWRERERRRRRPTVDPVYGLSIVGSRLSKDLRMWKEGGFTASPL